MNNSEYFCGKILPFSPNKYYNVKNIINAKEKYNALNFNIF